jgi:hypothetical protein
LKIYVWKVAQSKPNVQFTRLQGILHPKDIFGPFNFLAKD